MKNGAPTPSLRNGRRRATSFICTSGATQCPYAIDASSPRAVRISHPTHRRRFEVPFAEPCMNGDNRPITAPGNCWLEKSMLLPQPATSTRLRHNVERPRANYRRRDGRPKTPGAGRARRHESKWFATLGLARSIALRA